MTRKEFQEQVGPKIAALTKMSDRQCAYALCFFLGAIEAGLKCGPYLSRSDVEHLVSHAYQSFQDSEKGRKES